MTEIRTLKDKFNLEFYSLNKYYRSNEIFCNFIRELLDNQYTLYPKNNDYDFRIYDNFIDMYNEIKQKEEKYGLSRLLSGYTRSVKKDDYDIKIDGFEFNWNPPNVKDKKINWAYTDNAKELKEIGCIYAIQGIDLNYAGVIIGNDLYYDKETGNIKVDESSMKSKKMLIPLKKNHINNYKEYEEEIYKKVANIYYVLLTRGIKGCYVYIEDENLREYMKSKIINK